MKPNGVSIIVCCHNSAHLLPETLEHLRQQQKTGSFNWEVLIVDNNSSDGTAVIAGEIWRAVDGVGFRILKEPRLGLAYARICGFANAKYDIVSFIDDDNRVCRDWVTKVYNVFERNPEIGVCGGLNAPIFEVSPPEWFHRYPHSFAVGPQSETSGDITWESGVLCGAGLSVRRSAWQQLKADGFEFSLIGRQGDKVLCGEDYELCLALRAAGWKIWYEPALTLGHFLPRTRLTWQHLRNMARNYGFVRLRLAACGHGADGVVPAGTQLYTLFGWWGALLALLKKIGRKPVKVLLRNSQDYEGDHEIVEIEITLGEIRELILLRKTYTDYGKNISRYKWGNMPLHIKKIRA